MAKRDEDRCGENDTALLDCLIVFLWFTLPVNANRNYHIFLFVPLKKNADRETAETHFQEACRLAATATAAASIAIEPAVKLENSEPLFESATTITSKVRVVLSAYISFGS